jgi:hypothetical protein
LTRISWLPRLRSNVDHPLFERLPERVAVLPRLLLWLREFDEEAERLALLLGVRDPLRVADEVRLPVLRLPVVARLSVRVERLKLSQPPLLRVPLFERVALSVRLPVRLVERVA